MATYRQVIYKVQDDGTEEVISDEACKSIAMLGDTVDDGKLMELIINDNLIGIATKIASSKKMRAAAEIGISLDKAYSMMKPSGEDDLLSQILGGMKQ